ncbi:glutathione S-transferase [Shewanella sp. Isolate11]|uniref:glutathione S-transferase family protein n=1 Tax=Shewanella sp. Isolate11 TaxID=2908530 RepID=UPI001EFCF646|nr:glutathione S-transferase [Shewanella sp. Isolate11]MCG9696083.1 glutathione S-transferase [Shewanella sp. Isolate11]
MKLYELAITPNAKRVNIFLNEMGIEIERVVVNVRAGENLNPEFKSKSINGRIPLLELDDGQTLCESVAICRYFDELNPSEQSLFGNTPLEKAQIEMWQRICELQGLNYATQAFRNITQVYQDRERCVAAWGHESRLRVIEFLPTLEKQLRQQAYIAGERFTIADITAYTFITMLPRLEISLDEKFTHLLAWITKVEQRPAIIAVNSALPA